ncbi:MAG: hypothetical protein R3A44_03700 [Caldilineaceae bacterium]
MSRKVTLAFIAACIVATLNMVTFYTAQAKWSAPQQDFGIHPAPFDAEDGPAFSASAHETAESPAAPAQPAESANAPAAQATAPPALDDAGLERVAARVIGEGSFAIPQIACTVRNRWRAYHHAGLDAVLRAYHAQDVPPQPWQVDIVRQVFNGELPCPQNWWYALSLQDTHYWTPHDRVATIVVRDDQWQVWIFEK